MPNNFTGDPDCKAWWQFEPGALGFDTKGGNHFEEITGIVGDTHSDTLVHAEGSGSAYMGGFWDWMERQDADLDAGFPLKDGDATKTISVCGWVKFDWHDNPGHEGIFTKGIGGETSFGVNIYRNGSYCYWALITGYGGWPSYEWHDSGVWVEVGHWYHFGATYDDTTRAYNLRVWDAYTGAYVVNMTGNGTNPIYVGDGDLLVGMGAYGSGHMFKGWLDELVVFSRVLTNDEIDSIRLGTYVKELPWSGVILVEYSLSAEELDVVTLAPWYGIAVWPIRENLEFETEILQPHTRLPEQRIAKRGGIPRQVVTITYLLRDDAETARFDAILHTWAKRQWPVPIWWEAELHTANMAAAQSSITVDTTCADYRAGGCAMIYQRDNAEMVRIDSVAADSLSLLQPTVSAYAGDKWILPVRQGWLAGPVRKKRHVGGACFAEMTFRVSDNATVLESAAGTFYGWGGDLSGTDNPETITMDGDKEVSADFLSP